METGIYICFPLYGETDERGWCMAATDFDSIDLPLFGSAFTRDIC